MAKLPGASEEAFQGDGGWLLGSKGKLLLPFEGNYGPGSAQAIRSILVENIPKELRSAQQLFQYFERHFGEGW